MNVITRSFTITSFLKIIETLHDILTYLHFESLQRFEVFAVIEVSGCSSIERLSRQFAGAKLSSSTKTSTPTSIACFYVFFILLDMTLQKDSPLTNMPKYLLQICFFFQSANMLYVKIGCLSFQIGRI